MCAPKPSQAAKPQYKFSDACSATEVLQCRECQESLVFKPRKDHESLLAICVARAGSLL